MERIICLAIGYALGMFQTAYIYGRLHGIDIREYGSHNAGTTNTMRVLGTKAGLIVLACDIVKCMAAVVIVGLIFGKSGSETANLLETGKTAPEMAYLLKMYAAAGAILGHNFPFYLKFKGGKGIAATAGLILSFHPYYIPMGILVFFTIFFTTHYVSLGSLLVYAGFIIETVVLGQLGVFGMSPAHLYELYAVAGGLTVMAYYKHRENIVRLAKGEERRTYLKHKK